MSLATTAVLLAWLLGANVGADAPLWSLETVAVITALASLMALSTIRLGSKKGGTDA
jgi:hypothetical protein